MAGYPCDPGSHNKALPNQKAVRIWRHKARRQPPPAFGNKIPRTNWPPTQLTLELALFHLDAYFSLFSQWHGHPGLFLFLYLNKTCFILILICLWNLSWASQRPGGCLTLERSRTVLDPYVISFTQKTFRINYFKTFSISLCHYIYFSDQKILKKSWYLHTLSYLWPVVHNACSLSCFSVAICILNQFCIMQLQPLSFLHPLWWPMRCNGFKFFSKNIDSSEWVMNSWILFFWQSADLSFHSDTLIYKSVRILYGMFIMNHKKSFITVWATYLILVVLYIVNLKFWWKI